MINIKDVRSHFPQLSQKVHGKNLVYLDSAATTLKPINFIEAFRRFYTSEVANIHRGAHYLGDMATEKFENTRSSIKTFINARSDNEIVFTSGTTDSLNLIAFGLGQGLSEGDEILLSEMEHHSNIVPWQIAAKGAGALVRFISVTDSGDLDMESFKSLLNSKTKILSLTHMSNVLGTINPVSEIIQHCKKSGVTTVVDAAQSVSAIPVNVQDLDCDFLCFSAHKLFGPFGVGVLYGRENLLNALPPYRTGGAMISEVTKEETNFLKSPFRFEAGTPNISGVISFNESLKFINDIGFTEIQKHEMLLTKMLINQLSDIQGISLLSSSSTQRNVVSFVLEGAHATDVGQLLDQQGIAVRTGHHCTQPLMRRLKVDSTIRAALSIYSNEADVDALVMGIKKVKELLA